ncbi:response regulator transcription factor [Pseudonocardia sp. TRM90224]|uniref:response regulator transcription factor n=1 Tax=Pseudonocardia sp. TRM90224 TaxID=2812678 RepID=UPI001E4A0608|nr:response regulator transcription factor [Pseudonocardia sp. TRM90224]
MLLLDDHPVFADSLRITLDLTDDIRCVAVAYTVAEAVEAARTVDFDVAIVDLHVPDGGGMAAIGLLRAERPAARVIVLTAHPRAVLAERALAEGAVAFLGKDGAVTDVAEAIRYASAERPMVAASLEGVPAQRYGLTPREAEVLERLGEGRDAAGVADELGISLYTARDHIKSIMAKLGVRTQLDAVVTAGRAGLIEIGTRF